MTPFSLLSYNFVSLPWFTRRVKERLDRVLKDLPLYDPDTICFQEIWLSGVRSYLLENLKSLGYNDFYFTSTRSLRQGKNGLLIISRKPVEGVASVRLVSRWLGLNLSLSEAFVNKGYAQVKLAVHPQNNLHLFNVHLSAQYRQDIRYFDSKFNRAKALSLKKLAVAVNSLGRQKIIIAGDFNFPPNSWFYDKFIAWTGVTDLCPTDWNTVLPSRFRVSVPKLERTDYIFTKNIAPEKVADIRLLWEKPTAKIGYLSDHAALFARFNCD